MPDTTVAASLISYRAWYLAAALALLTHSGFNAEPLTGKEDEVQEGLRNRIEAAAGLPGALSVEDQRIHSVAALPAFYERRTYRPAWSDGERPLPVAAVLLEAIQGAEREGLRSADYHGVTIEKRLRATGGGTRRWSTAELIDLDLLLTDAYLIYASHLLAGRVDPVQLDPLWVANRRERDLVVALESALARGQIAESLAELLPPYDGYRRLREELARYRTIVASGGWPRVPEGPRLARGDEGPRVANLRRRLAASGQLEQDGDDMFDEAVERAVIAFQRRHGLEPDGVVGTATVAALNVATAERARQIELNMERWRWLPQDLGERHIIVNIANFELDVVESGAQVLTMRVVVGRTYRRTPVFSDRMTYLVFNPYWHVPYNLAVQDILPQIKSDPSYLQRQEMTVFRGNTQEVVDPATVDWSTVTAGTFKFRLRQNPGPNNALGDVKFMFPNRFNVYLHDTPSKTLFGKGARDFSSGCIRLERPLVLAEYLLRDAPGWTRARIDSILKTRVEQTVSLPRPIPVHLLYWTAWAEPDGTIQFRRDVYERDALLAEALREPPPAP